MSLSDQDKNAAKNRQNILKDDPDENLEVEVSLRERISNRLLTRLEEDNAAEEIVDQWRQGNSDRQEWLSRQEEYLTQVDEFIRPIYKGIHDWNSTLHLPTILNVIKVYHSRMLQALTSADPLVDVKARQSGNIEKAQKIQDLLHYTLKSWVNRNEGIEDTLDQWVWLWCLQGSSILKNKWEVDYTRFEDVVLETELGVQTIIDDDGLPITVEVPVEKEVEKVRTIKTYEGPSAEVASIEDVVIIGGDGDPQKADAVIEEIAMTGSDLLMLSDRKVFRSDVVKEILKSGSDRRTGDVNGALKERRLRNNAENEVDKTYDIDTYNILEAYVKRDVDGSGINSDVVVWIHKESKKILRATYLYRVMPTGMRPYHKIDFHKRYGATYGVGIPELLYSVSQEIDAIHNMNVDIGTLTSMPFGFYRPASSMNSETLPMEPGALIPLDNPQTDIAFPNLGSRVSFGFQEQQALENQIQRLTGISDLNYGVIGGQGATRTATGTRALLGENNANLDVYLKRLNRGWQQAIKYIFHMLQQKIKPGFEFRVLGADSVNAWSEIRDREELQGMFDFELDSNSQNTNQQIKEIVANEVYQLTQNPLDLQLGLVGPSERYEALKNKLVTLGIKNISKYLRKPDQVARKYLPMELVSATINGADIQLDPSQDLDGFLALAVSIMENDNLLGQLSQDQAIALQSKIEEAQSLKGALQQAEAQAAVQAQNVANAQLPSSVNASLDIGEITDV